MSSLAVHSYKSEKGTKKSYNDRFQDGVKYIRERQYKIDKFLELENDENMKCEGQIIIF